MQPVGEEEPSARGKGKRPAEASATRPAATSAGGRGSVGTRSPASPAAAAATGAGGSAGKRPQAATGAGGSAGAAPQKSRAANPGSHLGKNKLSSAARLEIVKEVSGGKQRSKVAEAFDVTTSYISKLMKPEYITKLEKAREMSLNLVALRAPTPVHEDLEMRVMKWINVERFRFEVRGTRSTQQPILFLLLASDIPLSHTPSASSCTCS